MALGPSVYKLVFDTQGLESVTASRRELALSRRIMEETTPVADKLAASQENLARLIEKKLITDEKASEAVAQLRKEYGVLTDEEQDAIAKEERLAEVRRNAGAILKTLETDEQRFAATRAKAWEAMQHGLLSEREYQQVLRQSPAALKARSQAEQQSKESQRVAMLQSKESQQQTRALNAMLLQGIPIVGQYASQWAAFGPVGALATLAFGNIAAGARLAQAAIRSVTQNVAEQIQKLDDLITAADTVNLPVDQFERLSLAAYHAEIEQAQFSGGVEKMLDSVSKASDGLKEYERIFTLIGVDATKLRESSPEEAFRKIVAGVESLNNQADKVRATKAIFGAEDFLRINTGHIERATKLLEDLRAEIPPLQKAQFDDFVGNTRDLNQSLDITWRKVAIELVPALSDAAELATDWLIALNQSDSANAKLQQISDILRGMVATAEELPREGGWIDSWAEAAVNANPKLLLLRETIKSLSQPFAEAGAERRRSDELDQQLEELAKKESESQQATSRASAMASEQIDKLVQSLRDEAEYAGLAKEEIALLKLTELNADPITRQLAESLASASMEHKRQAKAAEEAAKAEADAAKKVEDAIRQRQEAVAKSLTAMDDQIETIGRTKQEILAYTLADQGANAEDIKSALAKQKQIEALTKQADAAKLAKDTIEDLEKRLRQVDMTAGEKLADDLRTAGVSEDQISIVQSLQEELELREAIHGQLTATSGVMKANSRELADALAKANQAAVRQNFLDSRPPIVTSTPIPPEPVLTAPSATVNEPLAVAQPAFAADSREPLTMTAIEPPKFITPEPITSGDTVREPIPVTVVMDSTDRPAVPMDPFEQYYRETGKPDPLAPPPQPPVFDAVELLKRESSPVSSAANPSPVPQQPQRAPQPDESWAEMVKVLKESLEVQRTIAQGSSPTEVVEEVSI